MDLPDYVDEKNELRSQLIKKDNQLQKNLLNKLENKINQLESDEIDNYIIKKYIWLRELIKWNIDSNSSNIKFENLLK